MGNEAAADLVFVMSIAMAVCIGYSIWVGFRHGLRHMFAALLGGIAACTCFYLGVWSAMLLAMLFGNEGMR